MKIKSNARNTGLIAVLALAVAPPAHATDAGRGDGWQCSERTLRGTYLFSGSGYDIVQGTPRPKAITETIRFNGDGTLVVLAATVNQGGTVTRFPGGAVLGTYTVDPDCTGRLQFGPPGPAFDLFLSAWGQEFVMNQTGGPIPGVLQGSVRRIAR